MWTLPKRLSTQYMHINKWSYLVLSNSKAWFLPPSLPPTTHTHTFCRLPSIPDWPQHLAGAFLPLDHCSCRSRNQNPLSLAFGKPLSSHHSSQLRRHLLWLSFYFLPLGRAEACIHLWYSTYHMVNDIFTFRYICPFSYVVDTLLAMPSALFPESDSISGT